MLPFLLIIGIILIIVVCVGGKCESKTEKQIEEFKKNNNIPLNSKYVTLEGVDNEKLYTKTPYGEKIGISKTIYKDEKNLFIVDNCEDLRKDECRKKIVDKQIIPINDIICYELNGEYRIDNIVEGGGISIGGAIIGGVIAGGVGAILAGRKKIQTTQKITDNRVVYLYYKKDNNINRLVFNKRNIDVFKEILPNKNLEIIENNNKIENL